MNAKILALLALVAACLLLLFLALRGGDGDPATPDGAETATVAEPSELEVPTAEPEAPTTLVPVLADVDVVNSRLVVEGGADRRFWPEEETRWVEVRVAVPEGTPREEQAWVLALEKNADHGEIQGGDGPTAKLHAGVDPRDIEGLLGATLLAPDGSARIALPPDAAETWLAVGGSYLYTVEPRHTPLEGLTEAVALHPSLGARISGRVLAPAGDTAEEPAIDLGQVELELRWAIRSRLQLGGAEGMELDLDTTANDEGLFEFRAVPVGKPQELRSSSSQLARTFLEELGAEPGKHLHVELQLLRGGRVYGRVLGGAGQPLAGAEVLALGREFFGNPTLDLRVQETDADGRFDLTGVSAGRTWIAVRDDAHQHHLGPVFDLAEGEDRDYGDIELGEGLAISGTVHYPDGSAAVDCRVFVSPDLSENLSGSPEDPRAFIGAGNADTVDEEGNFRVIGLGTGPWSLSAQIVVEEEEEAGAGPAIGRWTAHQGAVHPPLEDVQLTLTPPVIVRGIVLDSGELPVTTFAIRAERAGTQWYMPPTETCEEGFEAEDGRFVLTGLRPGDWSVTAEAEGYARSAEVELELPTEEELSFLLLRPVLLAGTVVDPDGLPVVAAEVAKELEGTEAIEAMQGRGDWPTAVTDGEGSFSLEGLAPGPGSVIAKRAGFASSAPVSFELGEGEELVDLLLTLRRGGTITGEVFDEEGKPAANCLVIVQISALEERRIINTDAEGTFREEGLKPSTWQVQAFPGVAGLTTEDGGTLDQAALIAALKMTTVELADETEEHVVLGAPPEDPVRVHGRVTLDGEPVGGLMISFVPTEGKGIDHLKIGSTEDDGTYEMILDEPGKYQVTVQLVTTAGRQSSVEFRRSIPLAEEHRLDFEMPLGRVSGRVRGPDGAPVAGARVTLNMEGGLTFGTLFGGHYNETVTNEAGEYDIPYLRPGRFAVAAGGAWLGGVLGGDASLGRMVTAVKLDEGQWIRDLDFRLEEPGSIVGSVHDSTGALISGAFLFLRDEEGHLLELFSLAQTNASGRFEYPGLAPGEYTVIARTGELASSGGAPVRIRSGETSEVRVVVEAGTVLVVTLLDKSGKDVPSLISVRDADGREMNGMLGLTQIMERMTGGLGRTAQRVGPLPPGTYKVRAVAEDGRSTERPVSLTGRPERKVKLRLR
jgi:hypothetical protein